MPATLMPAPRQRFVDNVGLPLANGMVFTFAAGTSDKLAAFQDPDGLVPHENPIRLDIRGEATIYWLGNYKVDVRNALGIQLAGYPVDNFTAIDVSSEINTVTSGLFAQIFGNSGASLIGGAGRVVNSINSLKSLSKDFASKDALVTGYFKGSDGGGGFYHLDLTDTTTADNGGSVIVGIDGGRWKLVGAVTSYKQFGAGCVVDGDDTSALTKMIAAIGGIVGERGVLKISAPLPLVEGFFIRLRDNPGANNAGVLTVHSSVASPNTFDYFSSAGANIEHIEFSGVRFYKGRHVLRFNNSAGGFLSQVNFENCVFQELTGYVISATNSVFVIDFEKCRFLRCGGVDLGYGTNIMKFRSCGFEIMRREYIKMDGVGSSLPSASIHITGCRCEAVEDRNASQCFNIKGYGRLFNFIIDGGTYFESVYARIGTFDGVRALNIADINLTNSDVYTYTINLVDTEAFVRGIQSLVGTVLNATGTSVVRDMGGHSGGFTYIDAGSANIIGGVFRNQKTIGKGASSLIDFSVTPTGLTGATVYSTLSGDLVLNIAGSKTDDGTPIYCKKRYDVVARKMFGGTMALVFTEYATSGSTSDITLALTSSTGTASAITMSLNVTAPTGDLGAGLLLSYSFEGSTLTTNENPITARLS